MKASKVFAAIVLLGLNISYAQIIKNGSFECASKDPGTGWKGLSIGDTAICHWIVSSGNIDYIGTYWVASDSFRSVDLSGNRAGAISQSFKTVIDSKYQVQFDMAGNPDGGASLKRLRVSAADSSREFVFDISGKNKQNMGWELMTLKFTAIDTFTTLTFANIVSSAYGPAIDNVRVDIITSVKQTANNIAQIFQLEQNFPNPFNPSTTISFDLPRASKVTLKIFDLEGHEVATLANEEMQAGRYSSKWDASGLPGGVYIYRLQTEAFTQTRKLLLLR